MTPGAFLLLGVVLFYAGIVAVGVCGWLLVQVLCLGIQALPGLLELDGQPPADPPSDQVVVPEPTTPAGLAGFVLVAVPIDLLDGWARYPDPAVEPSIHIDCERTS